MIVRVIALLPAPSVLTRPDGWKYSGPDGMMLAAAPPLLSAASACPSTPISGVLQPVAGLALAMLSVTLSAAMLAHTRRRWLMATL